MADAAARDRYGELQAVVFDLDGTLVDSLPDIAAALNVALVSAGLGRVDEAAVRNMIGNGSEVLVARAVAAVLADTAPPALCDSTHAAFITAYDEVPCRDTRLYPGAREVLDDLAAHGVAIGICTNKPQQITTHVLEQLGIADLFGSVVGGQAALPLKPAPDMLRRVLTELGAKADGSVMVGDSGADARAAQAAGLPVILLAHGYCQEHLADLGADAVLPGFADLPQELVRVTRRAA